jgi:hypothetical protein
MKITNCLAAVICVILVTGCASNQPAEEAIDDTPAPAPMSKAEQDAHVKRQVDTGMRAHKLLLEAESRAMEQCDTQRIVVPLPDLDPLDDSERTVDTIVSITWSGGCVDGKRDGDGVLTWTEDQTDTTQIDKKTNLKLRTVTIWTSEGRFVKGQRLGLWCGSRKFQITSNGRPSSNGSDGGCAVFAGHGKQLTSNYLKQPDGSWMEVTFHNAPTGSSLAPGTLEAQSAKVLADAAAGKTTQALELTVHNQALDDLVPGVKRALGGTALIILSGCASTPYT